MNKTLSRVTSATAGAIVVCFALLTVVSCGSDTFLTNKQDSGGGGGDGVAFDGPFWPDTSTGPCLAGKDQDGDKIPDTKEGCNKDTDGDKIPDYQDTDADGDKILDKIEAGSTPNNPPDSDGDKTPDFQDKDSDNDGINDGDEDLNGDGKLGCCLTKCGEKREGCPTVKANECGKGQKCVSGLCQPTVAFLCSDGETDPTKKVTYPGGKADTELPTFICRQAGETGSKGLKPMLFKKSTTGGAWHLALEPTSTYGDIAIANPKGKEAGANFDLTASNQGVAGFILSMPATSSDVSTLSGNIATKITTSLPGKSTVSTLVSGTTGTSHDKFPMVVSTRLAVTLSAAKTVGAVRNSLFPLLLGRPASQISKLPSPSFGPSSTTHVIAYETLLRSGDSRVLVMGAVAQKAMASDDSKLTGIHLEDLSNGTGLATPADGDTIECDPFILASTPVADIIWVVDESGSMSDNRQDIVNNANDFFTRAVKSGLDFRMGVAGVKSPAYTSGVKVGKFCSKISTSSSDDGGTDRFLKPTEQNIFKSCVKNPPYYEGGSEYGLAHTYGAVTSHLPRKPSSANDLTKIRKEATLVIIIATDEAPQELKSYTTYNGKSGFLGYTEYDINTCTSSKQSQINAYVKDWITLLQGKHGTYGTEAKATVHLIAGTCKKPCGSYGPEYPWGYQELVKATKGQQADICQKNLGTTLQLIINSISGAASPAILQYVPISASLAVALNKTQLQRSRQNGFDYVSSSNSLVFNGVKFAKGDQVVASYRRWQKQSGPIE
jgi:hypothetical protein